VKTVIVLAMHGSPPKDVPRMQVVLDVGLHMALEHGPPWLGRALGGYWSRLDTKIRTWPRTPENDPFHTASLELARALAEETGLEVLVGYNEFCAPALEETLDEVARSGAERVIVVTPMMTRGGEHAEQDIPAVIEGARAKHPDVAFVYAWPFETAAVAQFLGERLGSSGAGGRPDA
jgi:sirohydrochlorin cobaltochelatase